MWSQIRISKYPTVVVSGLSDSDSDGDNFKFLEKHWLISRVIKVTSSDPELQNTVINEFESGVAMQNLGHLPRNRPSPNDSNTVHCIRLLSSVYSKHVGTILTQTYLHSLRDIAKLSGNDLQSILSDELTQIQGSLENEATTSSPSNPIEKSGIAIMQSPAATSDEHQASPYHTSSAPPSVVAAEIVDGTRPPILLDAEVPPQSRRPICTLPVDQLTTLEVQKVVVEHIVISNDMVSSHNSTKLRFFSGRLQSYRVPPFRPKCNCMAGGQKSCGELVTSSCEYRQELRASFRC